MSSIAPAPKPERPPVPAGVQCAIRQTLSEDLRNPQSELFAQLEEAVLDIVLGKLAKAAGSPDEDGGDGDAFVLALHQAISRCVRCISAPERAALIEEIKTIVNSSSSSSSR